MLKTMAETYIVTGGAGFIGSHIAERLLKDGHRVRIIDNFCTGKRENIAHLNGDLEVYEVSITDSEALKPIFQGVDYVFHQEIGRASCREREESEVVQATMRRNVPAEM